MPNLLRFELTEKSPAFADLEANRVFSEIKDFGISTISKVRSAKVFTFEGISTSDLLKIKERLLLEPLWLQEFASLETDGQMVIEVGLNPGVTNTEIDNILKAVKELGIAVRAARGSKKYVLYGKPTPEELDRIKTKILLNPTIERVIPAGETTLVMKLEKVKTRVIELEHLSDKDLQALSTTLQLFLSVSEMKSIREYFRREQRNPTDAEIETLAQTWSEHCVHKTFKSPLVIDGKRRNPLFSRIKNVTQQISHRDVLLAFSDNAGIIRFDSHMAVCAKTETHNSPSAIEPYGGAMTGSGGVFRDIAGTGLGAKNIASTDIFCFANPTLPLKDVLPGCLHPKRLMQKCIAGVRYYGNCMGIPTINGSLSFHEDYRAKPVVLVGGYGILPRKYIRKKRIHSGDIIFGVGGKTGRDGIHGATFSSGEMTKDTETRSSSAVQIGNPIEEIRTLDALLAARDAGIIQYITDCGAGGFSSAVGELAKDTGAWVDLSKIPLKYEGLANWEKWTSESQERMVVVIKKAHVKKLKRICTSFGAHAYEIGVITNTKRLEVVDTGKKIVSLDMEFLHNGYPKETLQGSSRKIIQTRKTKASTAVQIKDMDSLVKRVLSNLNIASKEEIVRRYDHEIQGKLVLKPYLGVHNDSPSDAAVLKPLFSSFKGIAISHGINVEVSMKDPYLGAQYAVDEAVRNLVATGCNPLKIFLLDNFIFPKVDKKTIGDLSLAVDGICDTATVYKTPFISGKDSLSGTYRHKDITVNVPPTICISALGIIEDVRQTVSSDFKDKGSTILILGKTDEHVGGTIVAKEMQSKSEPLAHFSIKESYTLYKKIYELIKKGYISACHDVSEGGMITCLLEMSFGGDMGFSIEVGNTHDPLGYLFSESGGRFAVEVKPGNLQKVKKILKNTFFEILGTTSIDKTLCVRHMRKDILKDSLYSFKKSWQEPFKKYF